jgi:hypothetical protein
MPMRYFLFFVFAASLACCTAPSYKAGDIYSVDTGEEKFRAVKVVAEGPDTIVVKMYGAQFTSRPSKPDTKVWEEDIPGTSNFEPIYMTLAKNFFREWEPELIGNETVSEEEKRR